MQLDNYQNFEEGINIALDVFVSPLTGFSEKRLRLPTASAVGYVVTPLRGYY